LWSFKFLAYDDAQSEKSLEEQQVTVLSWCTVAVAVTVADHGSGGGDSR